MKRILAAVLAIAAWSFAHPASAQFVCVFLNGSNQVVSPNNACVPGTTSIATSDARWTSYLATLPPKAYADAVLSQESLGIALTSPSLSCAPCIFALDPGTVSNLQGEYSSISGAAIIQGSISGTTLTVISTYSNPQLVANGSYVTGSGIAASTKITGACSGGFCPLNNSQTIASTSSPEYMIAGGLGANPLNLSSFSVADTSNNLHAMNPVQFLNYARAVTQLLASYSFQAWQAAGYTFPANTATIP